MNATIEHSRLGRIVIPPRVPDGFGLFYTTIDFNGHFRDGGADSVLAVIKERFAISASLTTCKQVHGSTIVPAAQQSGWSECDSCDALFSSHPRTALGIKVADCLPISIIDPGRRTIAGIHSGWRGSVQRITARTLDAIDIDPSRAMAWLGPSIRVCCFEVGEEVVEQLRGSYDEIEPFG